MFYMRQIGKRDFEPRQTHNFFKFRRYLLYMIVKKLLREALEEAHVDKHGDLQDFDGKIHYNFDKIGKFVDWFQDEYADYAQKQGWAIFDSDSELPNQKYHSERNYNGKSLTGYYWQVQRLDSPSDGEAQFGRLENDIKADDLAEKVGLMVDEFGVVYGWDGQSFI